MRFLVLRSQDPLDYCGGRWAEIQIRPSKAHTRPVDRSCFHRQMCSLPRKELVASKEISWCTVEPSSEAAKFPSQHFVVLVLRESFSLKLRWWTGWVPEVIIAERGMHGQAQYVWS